MSLRKKRFSNLSEDLPRVVRAKHVISDNSSCLVVIGTLIARSTQGARHLGPSSPSMLA
jgi:hypothetical protein